MNLPETIQPVGQKERAALLDVLRGFALLGITLANFPVLALYIYQYPETLAAMPTASIDICLKYFHYAFIDGKFYSIFSFLFGIGFALFLDKRGVPESVTLKLFYRRLFILMLFGTAHSLLLWDGDILLLYALLGMLLPLFRHTSDRVILGLSILFLLSPLLFDLVKVLTHGKVDPGSFFRRMAFVMATKSGITDTNYSDWLVKNGSYVDMVEWNKSGFFFRWEQLIGSNRLVKVFALFLLGLYAGRKKLYARLEEFRPQIRKVRNAGILIGLPATVAHAYFQNDGRYLPEPIALADTLFYALSVVPLSLVYICTCCLLYLNPFWKKKLMLLAPVGRMALTNYIGQSIIGTFIFYGVGLGLGATTGLVYVLMIAAGVYLLQLLFSTLWLRYFENGPLEWIWRQLTYAKWLPLVKLPGVKPIE